MHKTLKEATTRPPGGDSVGMEETADGVWDVYFGPIRLGCFDRREPVKNELWFQNA